MDSIFRKYLTIFTITVVAALAVLVFVSLKALFFDHIFMYQKLYNYQVAKIDASRDADTVFVGDSSLGNAIDAAYFSELSSRKTLNLALTGVYGLGGAFNMIKKAVKHNPVRTVVIMFQPRALGMTLSYEGYLYTFEAPHQFSGQQWLKLCATFVNVTLAPYSFVNIAKHYLGLLDTGTIQDDYVAQGNPLPAGQSGSSIKGLIGEGQDTFLRQISAFCAARNIHLVYAHGPLFDGDLRQADAAVARMDEFIRRQGVRDVVGPLAIPGDKLGDSDDHVRPPYKGEFTRKYYNLLKGLLI